MNENKTNINWYPGHMAKTKRQIIEDLKLIDIIAEIIDSRIPISSQIRRLKMYRVVWRHTKIQEQII